MKNKKVLWAIVLFLIFGFVAFAFANPFNNDDEPKENKKDTPVVDKKPVDVTPTPADNFIRVVTLTNKVTEPTVILDEVAPIIDDVTLSEYDWTKNDVTATVIATDNVALAAEAYSFDGGLTFQASNQFVVNTYTELTVIVKDAAGNLSEPYTVEVLVDQVNPEIPTMEINPIEVTQFRMVSPLGAPAVNVTITPGEDLQSGVYGVEVSQNDLDWEVCLDQDNNPLNPCVIPYAESGDYTLYARTVDNVGNVSESTMVSFTVDVDAPEVVSLTYSNEEPTRDNVVATLVTNEPVTITNEFGDLDGWTEVDENTYTKEYTDNTSAVITLTDAAGNTNTVTVEVNNIDRVAPNVSLSFTGNGSNLLIKLTSDEELQNIVGYTTLDNLTWTKTVSNNNVTISMTVYDLAGNQKFVSRQYERVILEDVNVLSYDRKLQLNVRLGYSSRTIEKSITLPDYGQSIVVNDTVNVTFYGGKTYSISYAVTIVKKSYSGHVYYEPTTNYFITTLN